jgi:hypothetical protein
MSPYAVKTQILETLLFPYLLAQILETLLLCLLADTGDIT